MEKGKKNRNRNQKHSQKLKSDSQAENVPKDVPTNSRCQQPDVTTEPANKTVIDPAVQFAGLKRETHDILKISEEENNKFKKREIFSNWEKYEIPQEENETIGANFEDLVNAPISVGGHFKFKSEKTWDIDLNGKFREYFSLDIKTLGDGLSSLSFYERQNLNKDMFSKDDISKMANRAERNKIKYNLAIKNKICTDSKYLVHESKEPLHVLSNSIQQSDANFQQAVFQKLNDLQEENENLNANTNDVTENLDSSANKTEIINHESEVKPIEEAENISHNADLLRDTSVKQESISDQVINGNKIIDDEDLDDLLNLKVPVEEKIIIQPSDNHEDHLLRDEPNFLPTTLPTTNTKLDLENWLDELLN